MSTFNLRYIKLKHLNITHICLLLSLLSKASPGFNLNDGNIFIMKEKKIVLRSSTV